MGINITTTVKPHIIAQKHITCHMDHQNRSNSCWDTAIFPFFKMAAVHHLGSVGCILEWPTKSNW